MKCLHFKQTLPTITIRNTENSEENLYVDTEAKSVYPTWHTCREVCLSLFAHPEAKDDANM